MQNIYNNSSKYIYQKYFEETQVCFAISIIMMYDGHGHVQIPPLFFIIFVFMKRHILIRYSFVPYAHNIVIGSLG